MEDDRAVDASRGVAQRRRRCADLDVPPVARVAHDLEAAEGTPVEHRSEEVLELEPRLGRGERVGLTDQLLGLPAVEFFGGWVPRADDCVAVESEDRERRRRDRCAEHLVRLVLDRERPRELERGLRMVREHPQDTQPLT